MGLRLAQRKLRDAPDEADELLARRRRSSPRRSRTCVSSRRESTPRCHTTAALGEALEVLAARTPIPVSLDLCLPRRLPDAVRVAAYSVVSEGSERGQALRGERRACVPRDERVRRDRGGG